MSLRRLAVAAVAVAAVSSVAVPASAAQPAVQPTALPTAAVALGDSFISGEGGGDYSAVTDVNGVSQGFPGWSADNTNAYFCHRSPNASLFRATLPGIQDRFNLGDAASVCANRFIADAWTGWWEFWAYLGGDVPQEPCTLSDLATDAEVASAKTETTSALRTLLTTLDQIDADGQHRVVFQDYTNPLPTDYAQRYWEEDGRADDRDKFRALGAERYAAGCPAHRASLAAGHLFSQALGSIVQTAHATLSAEFPGDDLVYLNVQSAFNGARLCENDGSPDNALARPIRLMDGPSGTFVTSLSGYDKIAIQRIANTCVQYFQTCQESWHPNVNGYGVLGQCLSGAATTAARQVACVRQTDGSVSVS